MHTSAIEVRDYYEEPGLQEYRADLGNTFNESISPFGGTLQLKYNDIIVPGNGGMDVVVQRSYTSIQNDQYPDSDSILGFGWNLHYGRVVSPKNGFYCNNVDDSSYLNPSYESPDGSRHMLFKNTELNDGSWITKSNWRGECVGGPLGFDQGMIMTSPTGVRYHATFNAPGKNVWLVEKIVDLNGNEIFIDYEVNPEQKALIKAIYRSEEGYESEAKLGDAVVEFSYFDEDTVYARIKRISSNDRSWEYNYDLVTEGPFENEVVYQLSRVIRPDGEYWEYGYYDRMNNPDPIGSNDEQAGSYSLKSITNPRGGYTEYTYQYVFFDQAVKDIREARTTAIFRKTVSGDNVEVSTWKYSFEPHSEPAAFDNEGNPLLYLDVTTVEGPTKTEKYYHFGKSYTLIDMGEPDDGESGKHHLFWEKWQIGLLRRIEIYSNNDELMSVTVNNWKKRLVSKNYFDHGSMYRPDWWTDDSSREYTYAAQLEWTGSKKDSYATLPDGEFTRTINYLSYDDYGNPTYIRESGNVEWDSSVLDGHRIAEGSAQDDRNRYIRISYGNDVDNWLIGQVRSKTTQVDGVDKDKATYSYDANGNLISETVNGLVTTFEYHSHGEVNLVEEPTGKTTVFESYKRGVPQSIEKPLGVHENIVVNDTGTIRSFENGVGDKTLYEYDGLGRITKITFPIGLPVNIDYSYNERTLTRGPFKQIDQYDSLGNVVKVEYQDTSTSEVVWTHYEFDPLGRKVFESLPNEESRGTVYEYDALNRIIASTDPAGNVTEWSYDDHLEEVTDANGNVTRIVFQQIGLSVRWPYKIVQPASKGTIVVRNEKGQVLRILQGKSLENGDIQGFEKTFSYTKIGRIASESSPEQGTFTFEYDEVGRLSAKKHPGNATVQYEYDAMDRVAKVTSIDGDVDIEYEYDKAGRLKLSRSGENQRSYSYDENGNITTSTLSILGVYDHSMSIQRFYNELDHVSKEIYPDGLTIEYEPNAFGQATKIGEFANSISYHPNGVVKEYVLGNGVNVSQGLEKRQLLETVKADDVLDYYIGYDDVSNISYVNDYIGDRRYLYSYDELNQLREAKVYERNGYYYRELYARVYEYDYLGNISSSCCTPKRFGSDYRYNKYYGYGSNKLEAFQFGSSINEYQYNMDGTPSQKRVIGHQGFVSDFYSYRFDADQNLRKINHGNHTINFSYDSNGMMVSAENIGPGYKYDTKFSLYSSGGNLIYTEEFNTCKSLTYVRLAGKLIAKSELDDFDNGTLDGDSDGMSDCLEARYGLNSEDPSDADGDLDQDGLTNSEEIALGSHLTLADSDSDGIDDNEEAALGTSPILADSDYDGLNDLREVELGLNPVNEDTDGDGIKDSIEVRVGLDADNPQDAYQDLDEDLFSNRQEALANTSLDDAADYPQGEHTLLWKQKVIAGDSAIPALDKLGNSYILSSWDIIKISPSGKREQLAETDGRYWSQGYQRSMQIDGDKALMVPWDYTLGIYDNSAEELYYSDKVIEKSEVDGVLAMIRPGQYKLAQTVSDKSYIAESTPEQAKLLYSFSPDEKVHGILIDYHGNSIVWYESYLSVFNADNELMWTERPAQSFVAIDNALYLYNFEHYPIRSHQPRYSFAKYSLSGNLLWGKDLNVKVGVSDIEGNSYLGVKRGDDPSTLTSFTPSGQLRWENELEDGEVLFDLLLAQPDKLLVVTSKSLYLLNLGGDTVWNAPAPWSASAIDGRVTMDRDGTVLTMIEDYGLYAIATPAKGMANTPSPARVMGVGNSVNACYRGSEAYAIDSDLDNDQVSDCFESFFAYDFDGQGDSDLDGLTNAEELALGTSFLVADTDQDGLSDRQESDASTHPLLSDTDGDTILDGDEIEKGNSPVVANVKSDVDVDGYPDVVEMVFETDYNSPASVPELDSPVPVLEVDEKFSERSVDSIQKYRVFEHEYGYYFRTNEGIVSTDHAGELKWIYSLDENYSRERIAVGKNGRLFLCADAIEEPYEGKVFSLGVDGVLDWQYRYVDSNYCMDMVLTSDNDLYVTFGFHSYHHDPKIIQFDENGSIERERRMTNRLSSIVETASGQLAGVSWGTEVLLPDLTVDWRNDSCNTSDAIDSLTVPMSNGNVLHYGDCVALFSAEGDRLWYSYSLGIGQEIEINSIVVDHEDNIYLAADSVIYKYDELGNLIWEYENEYGLMSELSTSRNGSLLFSSSNRIIELDFDGNVRRTIQSSYVSTDTKVYASTTGVWWFVNDNSIFAIQPDIIESQISTTWSSLEGGQLGTRSICVRDTQFLSATQDSDGNGLTDCMDYLTSLSLPATNVEYTPLEGQMQ
ncbi:hypothetical protein GCM10007392_45320 [Saccharospirillum salsuginis]|uniref:RHS repeat-associated core domain-containing protein n=2 Tax=Saccharospirillum salsuginis TaxID=418750 RepID=A0A918NJN6_9GAMM|nr:hypothetical protein GCM10007392_45320 [Saccharospirillum salsuginis]